MALMKTTSLSLSLNWKYTHKYKVIYKLGKDLHSVDENAGENYIVIFVVIDENTKPRIREKVTFLFSMEYFSPVWNVIFLYHLVTHIITTHRKLTFWAPEIQKILKHF